MNALLDTASPSQGTPELLLISPSVSRVVQRTLTLGLTADAAMSLNDVMLLVAATLAARSRLLVTFVNPASWAIARREPDYARQLTQFDVVLPDGSGMSLAIRLIHRVLASRISFDTTSLAPPVMMLAEQSGLTVALVGGAPGAAGAAMARLHGEFPALRFVGAFNGYAAIEVRVAEIAALDPDIVVCGMGAGTQEALLLALARTGWRGCGFTCGGYLDQLSMRFAYYPAWINRYHLRWIYRLAKEPRRLWRRYLLDYPSFVAALGAALWQHRQQPEPATRAARPMQPRAVALSLRDKHDSVARI